MTAAELRERTVVRLRQIHKREPTDEEVERGLALRAQYTPESCPVCGGGPSFCCPHRIGRNCWGRCCS